MQKKKKIKKEIVYYQPDYDRKIWDRKNFLSFMVFRSQKHASMVFPTLKIIRYSGGDIYRPRFMDRYYTSDGKRFYKNGGLVKRTAN